jgi:hypothetical protein
MLGVTPIEAGMHQRLAETGAADRGVGADEHQIPVRLFWMVFLHQGDDLFHLLRAAAECPEEAGQHRQLLQPRILPSPRRIP